MALLVTAPWPAQAKVTERHTSARAGEAIAYARCAGCHAVGQSVASPNAGAPAFEEVGRKYRSIRLEWELEAISDVGHYSMPAKPMDAQEIRNLTAYIRSIKPRDQ